MGASGRNKTWRHHLVGAAGLLAVLLLAALTLQTVAGRNTAIAANDGFLLLRLADGTPAEGVRVVALRGEGVRWMRETDEHGVVPFKRGVGSVRVFFLVEQRWVARARIDLDDEFVELDLPVAPRGLGGGSHATPLVAGGWSYEELAADVRRAIETGAP